MESRLFYENYRPFYLGGRILFLGGMGAPPGNGFFGRISNFIKLLIRPKKPFPGGAPIPPKNRILPPK